MDHKITSVQTIVTNLVTNINQNIVDRPDAIEILEAIELITRMPAELKKLIDAASFFATHHDIHDGCPNGVKGGCDECYSGDTEFEYREDLSNASKSLFKHLKNREDEDESEDDGEDGSEDESDDMSEDENQNNKERCEDKNESDEVLAVISVEGKPNTYIDYNNRFIIYQNPNGKTLNVSLVSTGDGPYDMRYLTEEECEKARKLKLNVVMLPLPKPDDEDEDRNDKGGEYVKLSDNLREFLTDDFPDFVTVQEGISDRSTLSLLMAIYIKINTNDMLWTNGYKASYKATPRMYEYFDETFKVLKETGFNPKDFQWNDIAHIIDFNVSNVKPESRIRKLFVGEYEAANNLLKDIKEVKRNRRGQPMETRPDWL